MYSLYSDLEKMFWTPNYILFRCLIDGKEYIGRPKDIHMGDISNQKFKHCRFQYWDSIGQYFSGTMPQILEEVKSNQVIGLEAIDTLSKENPSTLSQILAICNEISLVDDKTDLGEIKKSVPDLLEKLYHAIHTYRMEHPKAYTGNPLYHINEYKAEFENIDVTLDTFQYKRDKVRNLKEGISHQIHQLFVISESEK